MNAPTLERDALAVAAAEALEVAEAWADAVVRLQREIDAAPAGKCTLELQDRLRRALWRSGRANMRLDGFGYRPHHSRPADRT